VSQIVAITDAQWGAIGIVLVGLFAAVASVVSALIGLAAKKSAEDRIGTPNGHGDDIMSMLGKMLDGQTGQDTRLAVIERRQIEQAERLSSVERTQQTFCASVHGLTGAIEAHVDAPQPPGN
jgi:hypothetical protein